MKCEAVGLLCFSKNTLGQN